MGGGLIGEVITYTFLHMVTTIVRLFLGQRVGFVFIRNVL